MEESTIKEKILKEVRNALISKRENPFKNVDFNSPVFHRLKEVPEVEFAQRLSAAGATFVYCENEKSVADNLQVLKDQKGWKKIYTVDERLVSLFADFELSVPADEDEFAEIEVGITRCEYLIARFGSVMVSSGLSSGRRMFAFPETHIVVASASQVVTEIKDALRKIKQKYPERLPSQITMITGPSRTADIEKTLVMGAHGPRELYVFMVDDL